MAATTSFAQSLSRFWTSLLLIGVIMLFLFYYTLNETVSRNGVSSFKLNVLHSSKFRYGHKSGTRIADSERCKNLYNIAVNMLDGEIIRLPFQTNHTKWKFRERGDLDWLQSVSRRWSNPWLINSTKLKDYYEGYINVKAKHIKVKKYFITFACNCCEKSKMKAVQCARDPGGFDFTTVYDLNSLRKGFLHSHSSILGEKRGCGFWLWKPYIILKTLVDNMADNDLLMYQDAGAYIIRDVGPLLKLCMETEKGILVFHTNSLEESLTKQDAFILMNMEDDKVFKSYQRLASFLVLRKTCQSLQFVMEWLAYSSDPRILTDIGNKMGKENLPTFRDNRHDQTVLSLLSKKWELNEFRDPSQYGNSDQKFMYSFGPYKQLIHHTRDKS